MFTNIFRKKVEAKPLKDIPVELLGWRNNMWVMTPDGIGIITKVGSFSTVHLIDVDGSTIKETQYLITALRQAAFNEIPKSRMKITKEKAHILGYN